MTTIADTGTCTARFPATLAGQRPGCDRRPHTDRLHTACINGVPLAWADPDDTTAALTDWEAATLAAVHNTWGTPAAAADERIHDLVAKVGVLAGRLRGRATSTFVVDVITAYDNLHQPDGAS